jgi:hypothetical protein
LYNGAGNISKPAAEGRTGGNWRARSLQGDTLHYLFLGPGDDAGFLFCGKMKYNLMRKYN